MKPISPQLVKKKTTPTREKSTDGQSGPGTAPAGSPGTVSPARRVAFETLLRVEQSEAWATEALEAEFRKFVTTYRGDRSHLDADRRLAQEITLGVLRHRGWLDDRIVKFAGRRLTNIDPQARVTLRMALYQIAFLSRIPASAAVNEAVNLMKGSHHTAHLGGFVNAVLREALRAKITFAVSEGSLLELARTRQWEKLEAALSHPAWLMQHWARQWTPERAVRIALANNTVPQSCFWLNPLRGNPAELRLELEAQGVQVREVPDFPGTLEWVEGDFSLLWSLVEAGSAYVQDVASRQVAHWVGVEPGMDVLDMCAAPGGKTACLAVIMNNQGTISALEIHAQRVAELKANVARLGATIITAYLADSTDESLFPGLAQRHSQFSILNSQFDAVLVDAPCSGTGTLRRHPEIKWRLEAKKLGELAGTQSRLLANAAQAVKPGGILLYSTCSLEEKEGEEVARIFRNRHPEFEIAPPPNAEAFLSPEGFLRIWPTAGPDGFFAARFRRKQG
ncbi:MAG: 16S rRNA (cytosine(967)-C(5))-methyltransferase RsmB [Blastocatellia bacterium]|nr:16S rRNA (cytosine(967)-C(5))-methyltransferase RsmB [Blastocatellia bacterium]